jgi:hypothetical protein
MKSTRLIDAPPFGAAREGGRADRAQREDGGLGVQACRARARSFARLEPLGQHAGQLSQRGREPAGRQLQHAGAQQQRDRLGGALETWALAHHLLPYFAHHRLHEIDVEAVDDYRRHKVAESRRRRDAIDNCRPLTVGNGNRRKVLRPLAPPTINKTIDSSR